MEKIGNNLIRFVAAEEIRNIEPKKGKLYSYLDFWRIKIYAWFTSIFLSTVLTIDKVRNWKSIDGGRLIYAPPGNGKTFFIVHVVAQLAKDLKKRILIVLPRAALCRQYRIALSELYDPQILLNYTDEGLNHVHSIGPADIYLMQEIKNASVKADIYQKKESYLYLILDEVHAFVTDASFNRYTSDVFDFLMRYIGPTCNRLYLTATPDAVAQVLIDVELKIGRRPEPPWNILTYREEIIPYLTVYRFKPNYSYLQVHFFSAFSDIFEIVHNNCLSSPTNLKTLIFVGSKTKGETLMVQLNKNHGDGTAVFIDAETKNTTHSEEYKEMIKSTSFKAHVLIVTRFLDVGVDLKDLQLLFVIITSPFSEDIIQMLGRKRIANADRKVHLFLMQPNVKSLTTAYNQLIQQEAEIKNAIASLQYPINGIDELPFPLFIRSMDRRPYISYNRFTLSIIGNHKQQIQSLLKNTDQEVAQAFHKMIIDLLPNCEIICNNESLLQDIKEQALALIESNLEKEMDEKEFVEVGKQILDVLGVTRRKENADRKPTQLLHKAFKNNSLPYHIGTPSKGTWQIKRGCKS